MRYSLKKFNMTLVLALVLALLFVQLPRGFSAESATQENVLTFLRDVVMLDMTKYDAKIEGVTGLPPRENLEMDSMKYTLTSDGNELDAMCLLRNNEIYWCKLYPLEGSPLFARHLTNALDEAKGLLDRYQAHSEVSHIQPMRNILDTVTELRPMTETVGDIRLEITIDENSEKIKWMNAVNGITNTYNVVTVRFRNGAFELFVDNWNRYRIGSTEINVDREEAIRIAKEEAQKEIQAAVGDEVASTFTFVYESALLTMQPREDVLYPHWEIHLTLNKMVRGYGAAFNVLVWADTGEISYIVYSGSYGGDSQSEENPETSTEVDELQSHSSTLSSPSTTSSENNINTPTSTYLIAGTAVTAIAVVVVAVALKKRRK